MLDPKYEPTQMRRNSGGETPAVDSGTQNIRRKSLPRHKT